MKRFFVLIAVCALAAACSNAPEIECSVPYRIVDGTIVTKTPARKAGQESALRMACDPIENVRIGLVGCGSRGSAALARLSQVEGCQVVAICDKYQDAVDHGRDVLAGAGVTGVDEYVGEEAYKQLCEADNVDLVYVTTNWKMHVPVSLYAMEHGKHAAAEVPAAVSLEQCWQLVNTCERTRKHFMMLENCCYGEIEMATMQMARAGAYGDIYFGEGAYIHNLNTESQWASYRDNWRLEFNQEHRGDNYPTHGLGPVCWVMGIHRGDKMNTLVAMDSAPILGKESGEKVMGTEDFAHGDHTVTTIRTEKGRIISVQHNVMSPHIYSRIHEIAGSKGISRKQYRTYLYFEPEFYPDDPWYSENAFDENRTWVDRQVHRPEYRAAMEMYRHPIIKEYQEMADKVGGHGGMDYIMDARLIYCLNNGLPLDEDVYDAAEWCSVVELSRISLEAGSMPVQVPDFTRGDWNKLDGVQFAYKK